MILHRQSSQKPPDELFERFRQSFPDVITTSAPNGQSQTASEPAVAGGSTFQPRQVAEFPGHEDLDPTPRGAPAEPFRFTPSLTPSVFMDPTSAAFAAFANQPPGLFTPTPGVNGSSTYGTGNPMAGVAVTTHGLETPSIGISIGTPLSLSNGTTLPPSSTGFVPPTIQPHQFQNYQPFAQPMHNGYLNPSQYEQRPPSGPGSPMDITGGGDMMSDAMVLNDSLNGSMNGTPTLVPPMPLDEKQFRFHVVLNAPTAMIKHYDEIPVTYLNKGQAYAISIVDTQPPPPSATSLRYRTFIRISFHDETQRGRPAGCWQLWKEGRGTSEAHQRGGKLQAVEYVENQTNGDDDKKKKAKVTLEGSSFDGFSVSWSPTMSGAAETSVSVRFNFLSTDFSHSKGVKGIPVRLCAKTELISNGSPGSPPDSEPEISYCKVKLFRDHGAERKLSNDIMHVKKTIEKLKQQASQTEGTGMKLFGKKAKKEEDMGKPGKVQKHKRTWSMSSASSVAGVKSQEEDTNSKLQAMQDMFSSTRPVSVLYLRGEEGDDPDLFPVRLPGEPDGDDSWAAHRRASVATTNTTTSSFVSPTPSSASLSSRRGDSFSPDKDWQRGGFGTLPSINQSDVPMRVKTNHEDGILSGWIEAIGIDTSYKPPAEKLPKAVMCVYILPIFPDQSEKEVYHRAVYLESRAASCLSSNIATKCGIDPTTIFRTIHLNSRGLSVFVDDDFVSQMNEGQDMKIQLQEITEDSSFPSEWPNTNGNHADGSTGKKWELRLIY
ncbi:CP2 transcription factor-domain-containing protein [Tricharina praecox]|uniref:CP2 transcription factor-domain-containing protein n=1 Tax=Tricharina praecox TaxID=43433 RepID=UPI002220A8FE|nr:CP2 transcription factor-domain-containing protein [Tricharina praecox]KAI5855361.1 CP2 transcription factor-domain-containing protein [Tricharina praecox]